MALKRVDLVTPNNLSSYSFDDLSTMLDLSQADLQLERNLSRRPLDRDGIAG